MFGPTIVYWVSDKIPTEFGLAGAYAKFDAPFRVPTQKVLEQKAAPIKVFSPLEPLETIDVPGLMLRYSEAQPEGACFDYLLLEPGRVPKWPHPEYNRYMVIATDAIRRSIACGKFVGVVVINDHGRYVCSYDRRFFAESLSAWAVFETERLSSGRPDVNKLSDEEFADLAKQIESNTIFGTALRWPRKRIKEGEGYIAFIKNTDTVRYAWHEFQSKPGEFLAVTDRRLAFKGIITRNTIKDYLLGALAAPGGRPTRPNATALWRGPPPIHP